MSKHESFYENLVERLNSLRKREKRLSLTQGVFTFLIALIGLGLTVVIIEAAFRFGTGPRFFLLSLAITLAAAVFVWFVGRPLFAILFRPNSPGETDLALRVGNHFITSIFINSVRRFLSLSRPGKSPIRDCVYLFCASIQVRVSGPC